MNFKTSSATSTSTCSISCCAGGLRRGCGCSTRAAAAAATWSTCFGRASRCAATTSIPVAVAQVRAMAAAIAPGAEPDFRVEPIEQTSFPDAHADVVVASAVLHFARDPRHFEAMLRQMWRVLRPGGLFFARLASSIGMAAEIVPLGRRPLPPAGRLRSIPGRRARRSRTGPRDSGDPDRSDQDHRGRRPALDDDVGGGNSVQGCQKFHGSNGIVLPGSTGSCRVDAARDQQRERRLWTSGTVGTPGTDRIQPNG